MRKETCCGCIIIKDRKMLVVQENEGHWGLPKGHVEANESFEETAIREVKEETGLRVEVDNSKKFMINYCIGNEVNKTVYFFPAKVVGGKLKRQKSEINEIRWVQLENYESVITHDNLKNMLKSALKELGY